MQEENKVNLMGIIIWTLASIFYLYEFFLRTFIGSVADNVIQDLTLSAQQFAWVTSAYYITYGLMQIPVGILVDKFGVKKILLFGMIICVLSTFAFAHSSSFVPAFMSRLLMGFGSSFGFICLLVIASLWFPRSYFAFFVGTSVFLGTMGPLLAAGPAVKLLNATHLHWQQLLDYVGFFGVGLIFAILLLVRTKKRNADSGMIYLRKEQSFLYHLKILAQNHQVWFIAFYSSVAYTTVTLLGAVWGTSYLQALGFTNLQAANIISLTWLSYAIGCLVFGAVSDKIRRRRPILIFSALTGVFLMLAMIFYHTQSIMFYTLIFSAIGFNSAGKTVGFAAVTEHVDFATKATALGINNGVITFFCAILPIVTGYLINLSHTSAGTNLIPSDFTTCFLLMPVLSVLSCGVAIFCIKETFCKIQKEPVYLQVGTS